MGDNEELTYHFVIELQEPEQISKVMAGLGRAYTHYFHKRYETVGYLWQGRFKMQAIQKEKYLLACGRYIERNPVRAKMVKFAEEYSFSSAQYYCLAKKDGLTTEDPELKNFGADKRKRRE